MCALQKQKKEIHIHFSSVYFTHIWYILQAKRTRKNIIQALVHKRRYWRQAQEIVQNQFPQELETDTPTWQSKWAKRDGDNRDQTNKCPDGCINNSLRGNNQQTRQQWCFRGARPRESSKSALLRPQTQSSFHKKETPQFKLLALMVEGY